MGYYDVDWIVCSKDCKSTSRGCLFFDNNLMFWFRQKQNCVSLSTTEVGYIVAGSSCTQLIWMKQILKKYELTRVWWPCDNMSAINITKKLVKHSRIKHIDIHHHFIQDLVEGSIVSLDYM